MAQKGAIFVFCSSCKILNFANYISPRIIAVMVVFAWLLNVWTARSPVTISILFSVGVSGSVFHPFTWKAHKRLKYSKGLVRSIIFQPRNVVFLREVQSRLLTQFSHTMPRFQRNFFHKRPFFALLLPRNSLLFVP